MPLATERCSAESERLNEPMLATASTVRNWLLVSNPGPWGHDAFLDARLPAGLGRALRERAAAAGVRPILIRRPAGGGGDDGICFAVHSGPDGPWIERTRLGRIEDVLDLDLHSLGRGRRLGLDELDERLFLVCTHGRRDPCCAERGRPVARALARAFPDATWECSHIGGDRFAGNLVAFPHGIYFGRVGVDAAETIASGYIHGRLDLRHFRGRSCRPMIAQAAEHHLRVALSLDGVDDLDVESMVNAGGSISVTFRTGAGRFEVRVRRELQAPRRLTCRSAGEESPPAYSATSIARLP